MGERVRILISACLLGEKVRYDGGHKRDALLVETVGSRVEWVRVCPEADCGLPVPRESMDLAGDPRFPRLVTNRSRIDLTERLDGWADGRLRELGSAGLCGYVCKADSPSCGMERVPVRGDDGVPRRIGRGIFTRLFMERFPLVPVEEEGRLRDPVLRETFLRRVLGRR